ncbi:MAG: TolC family protein [Prevotella sp.]|nr:TolC family protein [Prevotella sp.]
MLLLLASLPINADAQRLLTLDSCRVMALRSNKQMGVSKAKQGVAENIRKAARTKYLPHVSAVGSYVHTSKELSILSNDTKAMFSGIGTTAVSGLQQGFNEVISQPPFQNLSAFLGELGISFEGLHQRTEESLQQIASGMNAGGQKIVDLLRTDTRNLFAGTVMVTQPVFMGGAIVAMNKMADIGEDMMRHSAEAQSQKIIYDTDKAYWQVVSLRHKQKLAESYLDLVKKLDGDVHKMIEEGVATRSDGLSVDVKVNEAEMTLTRVNDGLVLSKMLLCQTIGLPLDEQILLAEEEAESLAVEEVTPQLDVETAVANRPELKMLQSSVELGRQTTNLLKAGNLPKVLLTGGYAVSNPNLLNGFQKKFDGFWNIGVLIHVPIWNWGDVAYKVRAAKGATAIATLEMEEAREKITLQVNQNTFRVSEAGKKLQMARTNIKHADENLRMATLGFKEGVITPATVMQAQTAWLQAQSQKIDAEIDVKLSQVDLQKALGTLNAQP